MEPQSNFFKERRAELAQMRGKRRLSQERLARELDVSHNLIGQWERGEAVPSLRMAARIAKVYEVPLSRIEKLIVEMSREAVTAGK